ncbi:MAG: glycerophosphodiester phosphodiesterase [Betaproteobacteria bacterium]|nr:glycerophosphodiester phosphodiesterase [Betaproteobacteria bacterium]
MRRPRPRAAPGRGLLSVGEDDLLPGVALPRLIAHRGGGDGAPENTLAALRLAAASGFRAVEFDVRLSADGVPVLIHDDTVDRTTDGRGAVAALSAAQLARLDAGRRHAPEFAGERIPTLAGAAQACHELGLVANIEIKALPGCGARVGAVVAQAAAQWWREGPLPLLSSFDEEVLHAAARAAPHLPRGLLVETVPADWRARLAAPDCVSLHCDAGANTADAIAAVLDAGVPVVCYTVNDRDTALRLLRRGARVITDRLQFAALSESPP